MLSIQMRGVDSRTALFDQWTVDFNLASTSINWVIMSNYFDDLKVTQDEFKISDVALRISPWEELKNLHERSTSDACIELLINCTHPVARTGTTTLVLLHVPKLTAVFYIKVWRAIIWLSQIIVLMCEQLAKYHASAQCRKYKTSVLSSNTYTKQQASTVELLHLPSGSQH